MISFSASVEEARLLVEKMKGLVGKGLRSSANRSALKRVLPRFEESLSSLSPEKREIARSLYLEEIREVTFKFQLAVLRLTAWEDIKRNPDRSKFDARIERHDQEMRAVARLYELLK